MYSHIKILYLILSHYNPISFIYYKYDKLSYLSKSGYQITNLAENLGPIFIKILQSLAYRVDVCPSEVISNFKNLTDNVKPDPSLINKINIEGLTDIQIEGGGSIAQVFSGYLNGEKVAIKVKRNNILKEINDNKKILIPWLKLFNYFYPYINIINRFNTLFNTIEVQANFLTEYNNQKLYTDFLEEFKFSNIRIPKLYDELCTDEYIVMEWIDGVKLNSDIIKERKINTDNIINNLIKFMIDPLFEYDVIHGDLHPGNVLLDENNNLCILDFGLVCHIDPDTQVSYTQLVKFLKRRNKEKIYNWLLSDFLISKDNNFTDTFKNELKNLIEKHFNQEELHIGTFTYSVTNLARENNIITNDHLIQIEIAKHTAFSTVIIIDNKYNLFVRSIEKLEGYSFMN